MTANILCHASSTWTTRQGLRGGVLKGARCICLYAAAELLACHWVLPHVLKLRHPPALAPLHVNTTPQMTYFLGAKCVHKITTGKSYDELLQHDNKMRMWGRSENSEK